MVYNTDLMLIKLIRNIAYLVQNMIKIGLGKLQDLIYQQVHINITEDLTQQ